MSESRVINTTLNSVMSIGAKLLNIVLSFVMRSIFIQTLGVEYLGISSLFSNILTVLSLTELGIGSAITFALYKPLADNDYPKIAALMHFYKNAYRLIAIIIALVGVSLIPFLTYLINDVPNVRENITLLYVMYLSNTVLSYFLVYKSTLFRASQNSRKISMVDIFITIARTSIETICLLIFHNFVLYLSISIVSTFLRNLIISFLADKKFKKVYQYKKERLDKKEKKAIFKDIYALSLYQISGVVINGTDSIVISAFDSTKSVGYLDNYKMIVNNVDSLFLQFYNSVVPSIGNLAVNANKEKQYSVFKTINFLTFIITNFATVSFLILLNPFIQIWLKDSTYIMPPIIIFLLIFNFYIVMMIRPVSSFRTSNGLFVQGKYRPLIMAMINLVVSVVLVFKFGVAGVIVGTIVSRVSTQLWFDPYLVFKHVFNKSVLVYFKQYICYILITIFSFAITYFVASMMPKINAYVDFVLLVMLCIIIPNGIVIVLFRNSKEFKELLQIVKGIINKILKRKGK